MEKFKLKNGINIYANKENKFKTWSVSIYIYRPLNAAEASQDALMSKVLKSATKNYPTRAAMAKRLDWLYGTSITTGVIKYADVHITIITLKAVCDKYLPEKISTDVLKFGKEILLEPKTDGEGFDKEIVDIEKENLKKLIESYVNEKALYADKRCIEIMCADEPFGTDERGTIEELEKIDEKSLYKHYEDVLKNSKIDIFTSGDIDEKEVEEVFGDITSNGAIPEVTIGKPSEKVKEVTESMDVTQGKLVMGFRTSHTAAQDKCKAMVFNALFGGSPTSKLFNNVREKLSLAYYANTRMYFSKGIMMARSGIEIDKYDKVREEILTQLKEVCDGNITDAEMDNAIAHIINVYTSLSDDPETAEAVKAGQIIEGDERSMEELIEGMRKVTKEDVIEIAKGITLDTVYFLKN
ncbi:MAG: pitrilysin family protein [Bacillota bacterium]|nr:pitrilysin family protein [Bacillota bacterium]